MHEQWTSWTKSFNRQSFNPSFVSLQSQHARFCLKTKKWWYRTWAADSYEIFTAKCLGITLTRKWNGLLMSKMSAQKQKNSLGIICVRQVGIHYGNAGSLWLPIQLLKSWRTNYLAVMRFSQWMPWCFAGFNDVVFWWWPYFRRERSKTGTTIFLKLSTVIIMSDRKKMKLISNKTALTVIKNATEKRMF